MEDVLESAHLLFEHWLTGECKSFAKEAIVLLHTRCNNELAYALRLYYQIGDGVKKDPKQAFELFSKYASPPHNSRLAQSMLGKCYYSGYGCTEDRSKAMQLFMVAAEQGSGHAMFWIGSAHYHGISEEALLWWRRAVHYGKDAPAAHQIGWFYRHGAGGLPVSEALYNVWRWNAKKWGCQLVAAEAKEPSAADEEKAWKVVKLNNIDCL